MSTKNKFKKWLKKQRKHLRFAKELAIEQEENFLGFRNWNMNSFVKPSEVILSPTFKVRIGAVAYKKLFSFVTASDLEVSGLGLVKPIENGFKIYDIFVLKQISSGAHTDLDKQAMTNLMLKLLKEKGAKEVNNLRFWWHSHPHFGVSPSGADDATGERLANDQYLVSWIVNHNRDIYCRIELTKPFRMTLCDVPVEIEGGANKSIVKSHREEAKGKVKGFEYDIPEVGTGNRWVWNNKLLRFMPTQEVPINNENQLSLPLLRGAENNNGKWKELKGPTVYVNPITKQSSYNKEEVKCGNCKKDACGGCEVFQK